MGLLSEVQYGEHKQLLSQLRSMRPTATSPGPTIEQLVCLLIQKRELTVLEACDWSLNTPTGVEILSEFIDLADLESRGLSIKRSLPGICAKAAAHLLSQLKSTPLLAANKNSEVCVFLGHLGKWFSDQGLDGEFKDLVRQLYLRDSLFLTELI